MEYSNKLIGNKIKSEYEKLGYNQTSFAYVMNVTRQTVGKWEKGESLPTLEQLITMCKIHEEVPIPSDEEPSLDKVKERLERLAIERTANTYTVKLFNCEMGYLLCEEGYENKTRQTTDICKATGLSEEVVIMLRDIIDSQNVLVKVWGECPNSAYNMMQAFINKFILDSKIVIENILDIIHKRWNLQMVKTDENYELILSVFNEIYATSDSNFFGVSSREEKFYDVLEKTLDAKLNNLQTLNERNNFINNIFDSDVILVKSGNKDKLKNIMLQPIDIGSDIMPQYNGVYRLLLQEKEDPEYKRDMYAISEYFMDIVKDFIKQEVGKA